MNLISTNMLYSKLQATASRSSYKLNFMPTRQILSTSISTIVMLLYHIKNFEAIRLIAKGRGLKKFIFYNLLAFVGMKLQEKQELSSKYREKQGKNSKISKYRKNRKYRRSGRPVIRTPRLQMIDKVSQVTEAK